MQRVLKFSLYSLGPGWLPVPRQSQCAVVPGHPEAARQPGYWLSSSGLGVSRRQSVSSCSRVWALALSAAKRSCPSHS